MHDIRSVLLLLIVLTAATPALAADAPPKELRIGSVAPDIPAEMYRRLTPLTKYLSAALKRPVTLKLAPNLSKAVDDISTGEVDIAYLTPVAYLDARDRSGVRLVVKTVTNGKSSFKLMIAVRDKSPIRRVADLQGKTFAFGDKAAILQRAVVVGAGMPLEKLGETRFVGHYDNIAQGVSSGDFDAGILKDTTAFKWQTKGLRILYSSPDLPPYNIAASGKLSESELAAIRQAFLKLDVHNLEHRKVIQALDKDYDGFAETSDAEYDVVRKLIAPFKGGK